MQYRLFGSAAALGILMSASAATAADLYIPAPPAADPYVPVASGPTWDGIYFGINGGWGWAGYDINSDVPGGGIGGPYSDSYSIDADGGLAGLELGYDWQHGSYVFGVMGDIYWSDVGGTGGVDDFDGTGVAVSTTNEQAWGFDVLARLGHLVTPRTLVYALGGYSGVGVDYDITTDFGSESGSENVGGWTAGVGLESLLHDNLSAKIEYRYSDFGSTSTDFASTTPIAGSAETGFAQHRVLVGLNWRLGNHN